MGEKVAIVTGAGRGIGNTISKELAKAGYNVVIDYNTSKQNSELLEQELIALGTDPMVCKCDISNENEVKYMVDMAHKKYGHIDVLVNNAGIAIDSLFRDKNVEDF